MKMLQYSRDHLNILLLLGRCRIILVDFDDLITIILSLFIPSNSPVVPCRSLAVVLINLFPLVSEVVPMMQCGPIK